MSAESEIKTGNVVMPQDKEFMTFSVVHCTDHRYEATLVILTFPIFNFSMNVDLFFSAWFKTMKFKNKERVDARHLKLQETIIFGLRW